MPFPLRRRSAGPVAAAAAALAIGFSGRQGQPKLDEKVVKSTIAAYLAVDARTAEGLAEQDRFLAELESVALDAAAAAKWKKEILKQWDKGPKLEKDSGRAYLWEEEERGLFIVGGDLSRPKGLLVAMHGGGVDVGDAGSAATEWEGPASEQDWLAIFPEVLEKTEHGWTDAGSEEFVLTLIERARRAWNIDPDHVFLCGHSMGGYGTWTLGAHHADMVAGLAASAGAPTPYLDRESGEAVGIERGVVPNLRNVPLRVYQSDDDPNVPPTANRRAARDVEEARERWGGFDFEYWEEPGRGHDYPPGGTKALIEKIAGFERDARPARVVWEPSRLAWKRQFYWLWRDAPADGPLVVADVDADANSVAILANGPVPGLRVLLDDELVDLDREIVVTLDGVETFRGIVRRNLAALLATGASGDPARTYEAWVSVRE
jgi:poly(3-hydroxybutyrate) depolymerase